MKQHVSQELQKVLSAVQSELRSRQDTAYSPVHEVSSILHTLLKDGALRTNIPKLSAFSGERAKGEVSFEQWSYEFQTLRKTYSDSALREGIQHSLRGVAADTVRNMGPDVPLGTFLKKFTIVYGNVKSFDLLMWDFYCTDQGELPNSEISQMQRVQNITAKLVLGKSKFHSSSECLQELHWLPINKWIQFKVLTLVFKSLDCAGPLYLRNLLVRFPKDRRQGLCSDNMVKRLLEPRTKLKNICIESFQCNWLEVVEPTP